MSSYQLAHWRAFTALVALVCLLPAGRLLADSDRCSVCGSLFGTRVYTIEDMVTGQKMQVCSDCATLSTVCFFCGLPAKSHVLRIDPLTLPRGARLTTSSNRNLGDAGSLWLDEVKNEKHIKSCRPDLSGSASILRP